VAEVVFYTGGVFGHELLVTARDVTYGAASEWAIDPELSEAEATVIVATAALQHFFYVAQDLKVQETIRDEGSEWTYALSAQLLLERVKHLQRDRDQALELVESQHAVSTVWVNLLHERDRYVSEAIEPCLGEPYYGYRELPR
jgi:hypothetical protein